MNPSPETPLSPEIRARAEALVRKHFARCFWFWKPDAAIETAGALELVIEYLRRYGGKEGWHDASELAQCR